MLFPEARKAVEQAAGETPVWAPEFDIAAAREQTRQEAAQAAREEVEEVRDVDADGVSCRLYTPADARPGVVVHVHGGGFVLNDVEVHDAAVRRFANRAGLAVLSVDYRLAPEHRFPAARDDLDTVVRWLDRQELPGPTYLHGDSAGANLALVAALRHPDRFRALVLIYPFLDPTGGFESYLTEADGFDAREAEWYWQQYAASPDDLSDPDLAPLRSTRLGTLPPTLVVTAEHDPLRDEGEHLAARLAEEGVSVTAARYLGQIHGFWRHDEVFPASAVLIGQVAAYLREHG